MNTGYNFLKSFLDKRGIKYTMNKMDSGFLMADVWYKDKFFVFQFEDNVIGFSDIGDNPSFDSKPDMIIKDLEELKTKLKELFSDFSG